MPANNLNNGNNINQQATFQQEVLAEIERLYTEISSLKLRLESMNKLPDPFAGGVQTQVDWNTQIKNKPDIADLIQFTGDLTGTEAQQTVIGIQNVPVNSIVPNVGQVLAFDGSHWAPATEISGSTILTFSGDLIGTNNSQTVVGIQRVPVSTVAPTNNQLFMFNGTFWIPTSDIVVNSIKINNPSPNSQDGLFVYNPTYNCLEMVGIGTTSDGSDRAFNMYGIINQASPSNTTNNFSTGVNINGNLDVNGSSDFNFISTFNNGLNTLGRVAILGSDLIIYSPDEQSNIWIQPVPNIGNTAYISTNKTAICFNPNAVVQNQCAMKQLLVVDNANNYNTWSGYFTISLASGSNLPVFNTGGNAPNQIQFAATPIITRNGLYIYDNDSLSHALHFEATTTDGSMPANTSTIRNDGAQRYLFIHNLRTVINNQPDPIFCIGNPLNTPNVQFGLNTDVWGQPYLQSSSGFFGFNNTMLLTNIGFRADTPSGAGSNYSFQINATGSNPNLTSTTGQIDFPQASLWVKNIVFAAAFTAHSRDINKTKRIMLEKSSDTGSWNFVMQDDGLHVFAKKSDTELYEALIPWIKTVTLGDLDNAN